MRLKSSTIFSAGLKTAESLASAQKAEDEATAAGLDDLLDDKKDSDARELVDLTSEQQGKTQVGGVEGSNFVDDMDDFDLLEATIDPMDLKTLRRVEKLELEINREKSFIAMKTAYRAAMSVDDPMKISV